MTRNGDIEKEDAILPLKHAEQSAASENSFVLGKMAMVGLIADISRHWKRHSCDDTSVVSGILVKVNDGQKVWREVGLIARPNIEHLFFSVATVTFMVGKGSRREGEEQR